MSAPRELLFVDLTPPGVSTRHYLVGTPSAPRWLDVGKDNKYVPLLHQAVCASPGTFACTLPPGRRWLRQALALIAVKSPALADELGEQVRGVPEGVLYRGDGLNPVRIVTELDVFGDALACRSAGRNRATLDAEVILALAESMRTEKCPNPPLPKCSTADPQPRHRRRRA